MKKVLVGLVTVATLSTGAFASSNFQIGGSSNNLNSGTTKSGVYLGFDGTKDINKGILIGAGFNVNIFQIERTQTSGSTSIATSGGAYTMAIDALAGYTFKESFNVPLVLKAGIGYGVSRDNIEKKNSWNPQYNISAVYTMYKGFGLGARYNTTDATLLGTKTKISSSTIYLNIAY